MKFTFSLCFFALILLYLYTNDLMEWVLYFLLFGLCSMILVLIFIQVIKDWIDKGSNHKK